MGGSFEPTTDPDPCHAGEALFALGLALPLFAGGNSLLALEPAVGLYIFDLVAIAVAWRLIRCQRAAGFAPAREVFFAHGCLLVLGAWWMGSLMLRPSGPRAGFDAQGIFCGALLFTSLSRHPLTPDPMIRFVRGLLLGAMVTVLFSQYQYWVVFPRTVALAEQVGLTPNVFVNANFYNANSYAVFLAAVLILGAQIAIRDRDAIARAVVPFVGLTVLLSQSRAVIGLLCLTVGGLAWLSALRPVASRGRVAPEVFWVLLPAAAGAAAGVVDLEELWRVATLGRIAIWQASLSMIRDHWVLGVGLGGFGDFFPQYRLNTYYTRYPHSFLLEIGAELGIVGLVGILGFLAAALARPFSQLIAVARGRRPSGFDTPLLAVCGAAGILIVHGLLDIDWHAPANPILLFALLGAAQQLVMSVEATRGHGC